MKFPKWLLVAVILSGCAGYLRDPWRRASILTGVAAGAALMCDAGTTIQSQAHGWQETNPALGSRPSPMLVGSYFGALALGTILAGAVLPSWLAIPLNGAELALEGGSLAVNTTYGAGTCGLTPWTGKNLNSSGVPIQ